MTLGLMQGTPKSVAENLGPGDESLAPFMGKNVEEIFDHVARGVRFEPYRGILRGAIGSAIARSGNSADQSMLLAELLRRAGYKVRFARGELTDENMTTVIRGMYPRGRSDSAFSAEYLPYDPTADVSLREAVRDHSWVEVFQDNSWIPVDPSFPRAKIGETYASPAERFEAPVDAEYHHLEAVLRETLGSGETRELSRFSGTVADLALRPISLVAIAIPLRRRGNEPQQQSPRSPGGLLGGMGEALGGKPEKKDEPNAHKARDEVIGVAYERHLQIGGRREKVAATVVLDTDPRSVIRREWIEFRIVPTSGESRKIERTLFEASNNAKRPAEARRYSISIIPGRIPAAFAAQQTALAATLIDPKAIQRNAARLGGISPDNPKAKSVASELMAMDDAAGTVAGHLLALRFAAESDSLSGLIADGSGVMLAWTTPRILIAGVEVATSGNRRADAKMTLDLRMDEVRSYPYPGAPTRLAILFNAARGIQESVIEGALVSLTTGRRETATTVRLIQAAEAANVPLLVISASTRSTLNDLPGAPPACLQMMEAAIAHGREVIVPARAVLLAGAQRWGWWELNPGSGEVVGVMEDGQHQGMVEYNANTEKIGLNPQSGGAIGALVGALATVGSASALMLKYGEVTPDLVNSLEEQLKEILCHSCPAKAEAKVSRRLSWSVADECVKRDLFKAESGASAKNTFCDEYEKGFKCSAALFLGALRGHSLYKITGAAKAEVIVPCTKKSYGDSLFLRFGPPLHGRARSE